jgi:Fic family protein
MAIRNDAHWEALLKFFLKGVGEVSRSATETARRILELRQKHLALVRDKVTNQANAVALLDYLFEQPIVTARLVEERLGCAFMTADKLLKQFAELQIVKETTGGQRNRRFEYSPYLALFEPVGIQPLSTKRK